MAKRSCDSCKRRKVKCDFAPSNPWCTNCTTNGIVCTYEVLPKKRGPKTRELSSTPRLRNRGDGGTRLLDADSAGSPLSIHASSSQASDKSPSAFHSIVIQPRSYNSPQVPEDTPQSLPVETAAIRVRHNLIASLRSALPSLSMTDIVEECISLFMQYTFCVCPRVSESRLRQNISLTLPEGTSYVSAPSPAGIERDDGDANIYAMRSFALVTSICATVASMLPTPLFPHGHSLERPFLRASREMLKLYEDYDLEHPDSTSIAIRCFHSGALHCIGRTNSSWHLLGEAALMGASIPMRPVNPPGQIDPLEIQLRHFNFWINTMCQRSAIVLNNRAVGLTISPLDCALRPSFVEPERIPLLDLTRKHNQHPFEERLFTGTELCAQLWANAFALITEFDSIQSLRLSGDSSVLSSEIKGKVPHLTQLYIDFISCLDKMPPWIQSPDSIENIDDEVYQYQKTSFWHLRTDILVTFHCLRMVILQRCANNKLESVLGLSDQVLAVELRKTEIGYEFLRVLEGVPFELLRAGGEPCIEKIRQVGIILLELTHRTENSAIETRSRESFIQILNILSRLDSRVSMELSNEARTVLVL